MLKLISASLFSLIAIVLSLMSPVSDKPVRYLPLGDSYTICTGAEENESWPLLLSKHLNASGIKTELLGNPARNGYSTQNLIDYELPVLKKSGADFVTLLIGVNDWVRVRDTAIFQKNLSYIIDYTLKVLKIKKNLLLITIPDFGVTPQGVLYAKGVDISKGISEFNDIIKAEAKKRGLQVVDIFQISKGMKGKFDLVAKDGLHPSAKEYAIWETLIFPEAKNLLSK